MCGATKPEAATEYQASQAAVMRGASESGAAGRQSTILTGGGGVKPSAPTIKKTLLGP